MIAPTGLTEKQSRRLENLAMEKPLFRVVGWSNLHSGPILKDLDDSRYYITIRGTVKKL